MGCSTDLGLGCWGQSPDPPFATQALNVLILFFFSFILFNVLKGLFDIVNLQLL